MEHFTQGSKNVKTQLNMDQKNICLDLYDRTKNLSFILYVRKIVRKTYILYSLVHTRTYAYQGVRIVGFSENFAYVLNERSLFRAAFLRISR